MYPYQLVAGINKKPVDSFGLTGFFRLYRSIPKYRDSLPLLQRETKPVH